MIIIDQKLKFNTAIDFYVNVKNAQQINKKCNLTVHHKNVIEPATIINTNNNILHIKLLNNPIYITNNDIVILRQNNFKFTGKKSNGINKSI